jgi:hypothetical protein
MTAYVLALVGCAAVAFLLYCLWNFAQDMKPRRSGVELPSSLPRRTDLRVMPLSRLKSPTYGGELGHERRALG